MPLITSDFEFSDDYPTIEPSLKLDFANARALDPRIAFTRASVGTYVGANGLIKTVGVNEPRFDHDPATGESLGLLIEESRINFIASSETTFSGTATGDFFRGKEIHNKSVNLNGFYFGSQFQNYNIQAGDKYFLTGFIRAGSQTGSINIRWIDGFNTAIPAVNNFTYTPTTDGEFVSFEFTFTAGVNITMNIALSGNFGDDADFAIMQFEKGSFPTSYIPTSGSTVTRAADTATIEGTNFSSWYNQSEGTVFAKSSYFGLSTGSLDIIYEINDGGASDRHHLMLRETADDLRTQTRSGGVNGLQQLFSRPAKNQLFSNALGYKINDCASSLDGSNPVNDNSVQIPTVDRMFIGSRLGTDFLNGHIARLTYYPKRLTNAQLQILTQ
jgi:hypothetical protein